MSNSLEVEGLKKYYSNVKAVDGIDFTVRDGSIFGMLGPNGAGKTTTIETIIGLLPKTAGRIELLGRNPHQDGHRLKEDIGVQLQSPALFPRLTVQETLDLFASFYPDPLPVKEALHRVGLETEVDQQVQALSGGQRHRLAVGLSMVSGGEFIFLDEPTTGLDPKARRDLWSVIQGLTDSGVTVFLTTHYMDEAEELCDKLVIIDRGKIIARGSPRGLISNNFRRRAIDFIDPGLSPEDEQALISNLSDDVSIEHHGDRFMIYTAQVTDTFSRLMNFFGNRPTQVEDLEVRSASLEDVFLKLTGRSLKNEE